MGRSFRVGSLAGIGVYLHWTFFLLPGLVLTHGVASGRNSQALSWVGLMLAVFGCVLLHELGHALMARRFGIGTHDITLTPIGGIARLARMSERPAEEFWIAVAGPAVNVGIAVLLVAVLASGVVSPLSISGDDAPGFVASLFVANVVLVIFNLLPAFPMDGGRVLRALLSRPLGPVRATEVAATLSLVMAGIFVLLGLLSLLPGSQLASPLLILVGPVVYLMGRWELAAVRQRETWKLQALVLSALPTDAGPPPESGFSGFTWNRQASLWIRWHDGRPVQGIGLGPE